MLYANCLGVWSVRCLLYRVTFGTQFLSSMFIIVRFYIACLCWNQKNEMKVIEEKLQWNTTMESGQNLFRISHWKLCRTHVSGGIRMTRKLHYFRSSALLMKLLWSTNRKLGSPSKIRKINVPKPYPSRESTRTWKHHYLGSCAWQM